MISYQTIKVHGSELFYREGGDPSGTRRSSPPPAPSWTIKSDLRLAYRTGLEHRLRAPR